MSRSHSSGPSVRGRENHATSTAESSSAPVTASAALAGEGDSKGSRASPRSDTENKSPWPKSRLRNRRALVGVLVRCIGVRGVSTVVGDQPALRAEGCGRLQFSNENCKYEIHPTQEGAIS